MYLSPFLRVVGLARRSPRVHAAEGVPGVSHVEARRRHPTMAGLAVQPVHGWHCICERCEREARTRS